MHTIWKDCNPIFRTWFYLSKCLERHICWNVMHFIGVWYHLIHFVFCLMKQWMLHEATLGLIMCFYQSLNLTLRYCMILLIENYMAHTIWLVFYPTVWQSIIAAILSKCSWIYEVSPMCYSRTWDFCPWNINYQRYVFGWSCFKKLLIAINESFFAFQFIFCEINAFVNLP